jgi:hypothetical protein
MHPLTEARCSDRPAPHTLGAAALSDESGGVLIGGGAGVLVPAVGSLGGGAPPSRCAVGCALGCAVGAGSCACATPVSVTVANIVSDQRAKALMLDG